MKITSIDCFKGTGALGGFITVRVNTDEGISGYGEAGLAYGNCTEAAFGQCQDFQQSFQDFHESCLPLKSIFKPHLIGNECNKSVMADTEEAHVRLKQFRESGTMLTACWTGHRGENALMWRNFTNKMGICIKSSIHNFIASIDTDDYDICCGRMSYSGIHTDTEILDCLFTKDKAFADEDEIRFYFTPRCSQSDKTDKGVSIPVLPQVLIDEIILSPYIDTRACKVLADFINEKYNNDKQNRFRVRTSEIKLKL